MSAQPEEVEVGVDLDLDLEMALQPSSTPAWQRTR